MAAWLREIVQEAVGTGDLAAASASTAGDVAFAIFSMVIGTHLCILNFPHVLEQLGVVSPHNTMKDNAHAMSTAWARAAPLRVGLQGHSRSALSGRSSMMNTAAPV